MSGLWVEFLANKHKYLQYGQGLGVAIGFVLIYYIVYFFTSNDLVLHEILKFSLETLPWSLITSLFVHNSNYHLQSNSTITVLFGSFFFYYRGIRQGVLYYLIIGAGAHICEIIIGIPLNILLRFYLETLKGQDFSTIGSFWLMSPSGAGASGSLMGMILIVGYEWIQRLKESYTEFKHNNTEKSTWEYLTLNYLFLYIFPPSIAIFSLLERFLADLDRLGDILYGIIRFYSPDPFIFLAYLITLIPSDGTGNALLSHIYGMVIGLTILLYERKQKIVNSKNLVLEFR